jgi:hypothetical protein
VLLYEPSLSWNLGQWRKGVFERATSSIGAMITSLAPAPFLELGAGPQIRFGKSGDVVGCIEEIGFGKSGGGRSMMRMKGSSRKSHYQHDDLSCACTPP